MKMSSDFTIITSERLRNELSADRLATALRRFLLIDVDTLLYNKIRTREKNLKWKLYKTFVVAFYPLYILRLMMVIKFNSKEAADQLADFFRFFGGETRLFCLGSICFAMLGALSTIYAGFFAIHKKRA